MDGPIAKQTKCVHKDIRYKLNDNAQLNTLKPLPPIACAEEADRIPLLLSKLDLCCTIVEFPPTPSQTAPDAPPDAMRVKLDTLLEVSAYLFEPTVDQMSLTCEDRVYGAVVRMFATNIFRSLPPALVVDNPYEPPDSADEAETLEPAWPHLEIVYEIVLRFLSLMDIKTLFLKKHIDQVFVLNLLDIFDAQDRRERNCAKMILHKIYTKVVSLRPFIRKQMVNTFYTFVYETERFNGIGELLEIFGNIISGCQTPLKQDEIKCLCKVILPLHKPHQIAPYHPQLAYCIVQFLEKDPSLLTCIVNGGILRFWPKTHSAKVVMFINELEEFIELGTDNEFRQLLVPVFTQLSKCYNSRHFQIAERSLIFTDNTTIFKMVSPHIKEILPIVLPALRAALNHWHLTIQGHAETALAKWKAVDAELFENCEVEHVARKERQVNGINGNHTLWLEVDKTASLNTPGEIIELNGEI